MAESSAAELLRESTDSVAKLQKLRLLKDDMIGQVTRKEYWIGEGIVPFLAHILRSYAAGHENYSGQAQRTTQDAYSEEDDVCKQAITIVSSLANGGHVFTYPIFAGGLPDMLLSILSSGHYPLRIRNSAVSALWVITDNLPLADEQNTAQFSDLAYKVFSGDIISRFCEILRDTNGSYETERLAAMVENLIANSCKCEQTKLLCTKLGLLDALAFKLSTFVVRQGFVIPGADRTARNLGTPGALPEPASHQARLGPLLRAISVLISNSRPRADYFISSPALVTVFAPGVVRLRPNRDTPWAAHKTTESLLDPASALDALLPQMNYQPPPHTPFPPIAESKSSITRFNTSRIHEMFSSQDLEEPSKESALLPWLICVSREELGFTRLNAIRLIAILYQLRCVKANRTRMLAVLLLPSLFSMMNDPAREDVENKDYLRPATSMFLPSGLQNQAAFTLAVLVRDSPVLQDQAVTTGAIQQLVIGLQATFVPLPKTSARQWNPTKHENCYSVHQRSGESETELGPTGLSPLFKFRMKTRENYLLALMSLALYQDDHRKEICDRKAIPSVLKSLTPLNMLSEPDISQNTTPTIVAACAALKALTRSPFVIAVILKDFETCKGVFDLLKSPCLEVQSTALQVVVNLACDCCRVRSNPAFSGYIPILCEYTRSQNLRLQVEAMWAISNLAYQSELDTKLRLWRLANPDLVKNVINQDPSSSVTHDCFGEPYDTGTSYPMATQNTIGAHAEISNPADMESDTHVGNRQNSEAITSTSIFNDRIESLEASDYAQYIKEARKLRTLFVQKALDLIRNLICGPGSAEMLEHVLMDIGLDQLFAILLDRIRPWTTVPSPKTKVSQTNAAADDQVIISATSIFVHFAICSPQTADILLKHRPVMNTLVTLFSHYHADVRRNCVWVVLNCLCPLRDEDTPMCRTRARLLEDLQIEPALHYIENHDRDTDVKERGRVARASMNELLDR